MNISPKKGGFNGKKEKQCGSPVRIWARPRFCLEGGEITMPWGRKTNPSVAETLRNWSEALGLPGQPRSLKNQEGLRISVYGDDTKPAFL
jgi:hypothetical protein